MSHTIPGLRSEEIDHILRRHGFEMISQHGSHQKWRNTVNRKQVIVPFHKGRQLPTGTVRSIIHGSGIPVEQFAA